MIASTRRHTRIAGPRGLRLTLATGILLLVLPPCFALVLVACGGGQTAAATTTSPAASPAAPDVIDVTLVMDWVPWVLDIPVDVAQEKGFYEERGLRVDQMLPAGPTDVVKFVSTGKAQFGLYYAPDTLLGAAAEAPLLSVAGLMTHAPLGMAMAPGVRADEPADLPGKTAGVVMIPSTRASFDTMLKAGGVDSSSVKVLDPGFELVAPLLAGKYDTVAVTEFAELVQAEAAGSALDYLDFREWGTPDYAFLNVLTQQRFANENPATVSAFVAATLAGLEYAVANPEEAVDVYVRRHPELDRELLLAQWETALPSLAAGDGVRTGAQDLESWRSLGEWMVETGQLEREVDVTAVVTDQYLPQP